MDDIHTNLQLHELLKQTAQTVTAHVANNQPLDAYVLPEGPAVPAAPNTSQSK